MSLLAKYKASAAMLVAAAAVGGLLSAPVAHAEDLTHYDSTKKDYWLHPPDDWVMDEEIIGNLKNVKLPPGFKIELWASGLPQARQMAWGKDGTLFVGSFLATNVYSVTDQGGERAEIGRA